MTGEIKATTVSNKGKGSLFRSLNNVHKFGVVVDQKRLHTTIFDHKESKQRFLDYAFKIGLKRALQALDVQGVISFPTIERMYIQCDEHSTATDGLYGLREGLLEEFKYGTHNYRYNIYFNPICPTMIDIALKYTDSSHSAGIRMADIVANRIYYHARKGDFTSLQDKVFISYLP